MHAVGRYYAAVWILDDNSTGRQHVNIVLKNWCKMQGEEKQNSFNEEEAKQLSLGQFVS